MPRTFSARHLRRSVLALTAALALGAGPAASAGLAQAPGPAVQGPLVQGPLIQGPLIDLGDREGATCPDGSAPQSQQGVLQRQESCGAASQQQSPLLGQQQQPTGA